MFAIGETLQTAILSNSGGASKMSEVEWPCCRTFLISGKTKNRIPGRHAVLDGQCNMIYVLFIEAVLKDEIIPIGNGDPPRNPAATIRVEKIGDDGPPQVSVFGLGDSDNQDNSYYEMELNDWESAQRGRMFETKDLSRASSKPCSACGVFYAISVRRYLDTQGED